MKLIESKDFRLENYKTRKYLVFNRGFLWKFCKDHILQLQKDKKLFEKEEIDIILICPEQIKRVEYFVKKHNLELNFVSDASHDIAEKYNQDFSILKLGRLPMQILLDGIDIVFEYRGKNMLDILKNDEIIKKNKWTQYFDSVYKNLKAWIE